MNSNRKHLKSVEDFGVVFKEAHLNGIDLVLVGGQACSFFALRYRSRSKGLEKLYPYTSKDIDFFGGEYEADALARVLQRKLKRSPRKGGMLGLSVGKIEVNPETLIEIVGSICGLSDREVKKLVLLEEFKGSKIQILHPVLLYVSKAACLLTLDQKGRQDRRHLQLLEYILPEYLKDLLQDEKREKEFLQSCERLCDFLISRHGLELVNQGHRSSCEFFPVIPKIPSVKIRRFYEKRLPQIKAELEKRLNSLRLLRMEKGIKS